jgi:hypothetical protein
MAPLNPARTPIDEDWIWIIACEWPVAVLAHAVELHAPGYPLAMVADHAMRAFADLPDNWKAESGQVANA